MKWKNQRETIQRSYNPLERWTVSPLTVVCVAVLSGEKNGQRRRKREPEEEKRGRALKRGRPGWKVLLMAVKFQKSLQEGKVGLCVRVIANVSRRIFANTVCFN